MILDNFKSVAWGEETAGDVAFLVGLHAGGVDCALEKMKMAH